MKPVITVEQRPLNRSFAVSHMTTEAVAIVRLRLFDDAGEPVGAGEISADPGYRQDGDAIALEAGNLAEQLRDADPARLRALLERAAATVSGPARTLVEMAFLDCAARAADVPVWRLLGLPDPGRVQLLHTIPLGEQIPAVPLGPLKVKLGGAQDEDVLRRLVGLPGPIILDVNRGWDRERWTHLRPLLEEIGPAVLEDPVDRDELLAEVRAALPGTAVILDEGIGTRAEIDRAVRVSDGANVKVMKLGGLFAAIDALTDLTDRGATRMLGCFLEPPRSIAYAAQLNALCDWTDLDGHFWLTDAPEVLSYRLNSGRPGIPVIEY